MKKLLTLTGILLILLGASSMAIAQDIPKSGAVIRCDDQSITLTTGQTTEVEIYIARSRGERKTKFDTPVVQAIEGLHASITPTEVKDTYVLAMTPTSLPEGGHLLIIEGSGQYKRYLTSKALSIKMLGEEDALASTHQ